MKELHAMALTFGNPSEERQGWSDALRATRRAAPSLLRTAAAAALLCVLALGAVHVLRPAAAVAATPRAASPLQDVDLPEPTRTRCGNCGVVESIRPLPAREGEPAAYEFTVRL